MEWIKVEGTTVRCPHCQEPLWQKGEESTVWIRKVDAHHRQPASSLSHAMKHGDRQCNGRLEFIVQQARAA
jgi:hypothetical protein